MKSIQELNERNTLLIKGLHSFAQKIKRALHRDVYLYEDRLVTYALTFEKQYDVKNSFHANILTVIRDDIPNRNMSFKIRDNVLWGETLDFNLGYYWKNKMLIPTSELQATPILFEYMLDVKEGFLDYIQRAPYPVDESRHKCLLADFQGRRLFELHR